MNIHQQLYERKGQKWSGQKRKMFVSFFYIRRDRSISVWNIYFSIDSLLKIRNTQPKCDVTDPLWTHINLNLSKLFTKQFPPLVVNSFVHAQKTLATSWLSSVLTSCIAEYTQLKFYFIAVVSRGSNKTTRIHHESCEAVESCCTHIKSL